MKRLLLLALLLLIPSRVAAQADPISWDVIAGFNGTFKFGAWIPITITVTNNGNDLRGQLEWRWTNGPTHFSQSIDLPRGANKRIVLPVVADAPFGGDATIRLTDGNQVVSSKKISYRQVDVTSLVVGVLSDASNALPEVGGIHAQVANGTTLVHLDRTTMPERAELLQSIDILFIHDTDTSAWNDAQRTALAVWVADGGRLVLGGDRPSTVAGLGALAPAKIKPGEQDAPLAALSTVTGWKLRDPAARTRTLTLSPAPGTVVVAATPDGIPLVVQQSYGAGEVLQCAFNLLTLSQQGDPVPLWERLLPWSGQLPQWQMLRSNGEWLLRQSLVLSALRLPSIWILLLFLIVYIALVGPVNYLVLRRLDRREWAYLTVPVTVVIFTLGAYTVGTSGRGSAATANALTLVRAAPGSTTGHALSYLGIFSPIRRTYDLKLNPDTFVSRTDSNNDRASGTLEIVRAEAATEVRQFLIDVGGLRPLLAESMVPVPEITALYHRGANGKLTLEIKNRSGEPLQDVALIGGQGTQKLEDVPAGAQRTIQVEQTGFFGDLPFHQGSIINRNAALNTLRGSFIEPLVGPNKAIPAVQPLAPAGPTDTLILVAWASGHQVDLALNDAPVQVQGDTLYMWPVEAAQ